MTHQKKINELIKDMSKSLKAESVRLLKCGAVDKADYNADEYALAKIIMTAAMHNLKDVYRPLNEAHRKTLKNLMHF